MAVAERTEVFDVDIETLYATIVDYESYPDFVDGVSAIKIIKRGKDSAQVEYSLNLIKSFKYVLELKEKKPTDISWNLISGDLFKSNKGHWKLKDLGKGKTEVTYALEVDFKGFAPKMVVNKLVANNLPAMMKAYCDRAKAKKK